MPKGAWQSQSVLIGQQMDQQNIEIDRVAKKQVQKKATKGQMEKIFNKLHSDADRRKELEQERKIASENKIKEKYQTATQKYSENNQVFLCIRITKELKTSYETDVKIDLGKKIAYPVFVKILSLLGYLNQYRNEEGRIETKSTEKEE